MDDSGRQPTTPRYLPSFRELPGESERLIQRTPIPGTCGPLPETVMATCTMGVPSWTAETVYPTDAANLVLLVVTGSVSSTITLRGPDRQLICTFPGTPVNFAKVIALWAPQEAHYQVEVMGACGGCVVEGDTVCCPIGLCIVVDSDAPNFVAWWLPR
ncbi:MAG: hypothetical protein ACM3XZ_03180 [Betaproteobacteria bacterium]